MWVTASECEGVLDSILTDIDIQCVVVIIMSTYTDPNLKKKKIRLA